jgi:hypothetical protein
LFYRITKQRSYVAQKAREMSEDALANTPPALRSASGLCDAGALATGKEKEPQAYKGHDMEISQEHSKSTMIGSYRHRVVVAPHVRVDPPLSRAEILFNLQVVRDLYRAGL